MILRKSPYFMENAYELVWNFPCSSQSQNDVKGVCNIKNHENYGAIQLYEKTVFDLTGMIIAPCDDFYGNRQLYGPFMNTKSLYFYQIMKFTFFLNILIFRSSNQSKVLKNSRPLAKSSWWQFLIFFSQGRKTWQLCPCFFSTISFY